MNRAATRCPQPKPRPNPKPKIHSQRSPLKELNAGTFKTEPPNNCFRFRCSNSSSSSSASSTNPTNREYRHERNSINPRNASITKTKVKSSKPLDQGRKIGDRSADLEVERVSKVNRLRRGQTVCRKKVVSAGRDDLLCSSGGLEKAGVKSGKDFEFTPVGCKTGSIECGFDKTFGSGDCDENNGNGNTPPVEATVSPEILCGSTVMSAAAAATPVCFGHAGHVLSDVSDKRKCRPRGVLVVGDNCKGIDGVNSSNEELDGIGDVESGCDLVPFLPVEASMHWLLSPCEEDVDRNGENELRTSICRESSLSGSSGYGTSRTGVARSSPLVSASESLLFQCLLESPSDNMASSSSQSPSCTRPNDGVESCFDEKICFNLTGQNSACSKDTLGSENAIRTPESYSSLERHMNLPWFHADDGMHAIESNLDHAMDGQQGTNISSEGDLLALEQIDSSFEFDCHRKPATSIEFSQLQDNWDKSYWVSDAVVENEPSSQFRISWRDGLSSHPIDMEDSECCRCLSDEEDKNHQYSYSSSPESKLPEINAVSFMKKFDVKSAFCMNKIANSALQKDIPFAESISLGGGSLASSGDSGCEMCYKNSIPQNYLYPQLRDQKMGHSTWNADFYNLHIDPRSTEEQQTTYVSSFVHLD